LLQLPFFDLTLELENIACIEDILAVIKTMTLQKIVIEYLGFLPYAINK